MDNDNVTLSDDERQFIWDRLFIESEHGTKVYNQVDLDYMSTIMDKLQPDTVEAEEKTMYIEVQVNYTSKLSDKATFNTIQTAIGKSLVGHDIDTVHINLTECLDYDMFKPTKE